MFSVSISIQLILMYRNYINTLVSLIKNWFDCGQSKKVHGFLNLCNVKKIICEFIELQLFCLFVCIYSISLYIISS